jgi:hypothetical protein
MSRLEKIVCVALVRSNASLSYIMTRLRVDAGTAMELKKLFNPQF